jgi:acyl carrier protein
MGNQGILVESIQQWLSSRVAVYGDLSPESFDINTPFTELGFNSVYALTLCGDIEDDYGYDADPSMIWDHKNIRELATALCNALRGQ